MNHVFACLVATLLVGGCASPEPPAGPATDDATSPRAGATYVGDVACADCHEDLYVGFQTHGMAQSFTPMTAEAVIADFSGEALYHAPSDYYYRVYEEDGRYYQEEYRLGPGGQKVHRLVREMQYAVGSGTAGRTYLSFNNGRYYELPLSWYSQARRWDFSPGYDAHNQRFNRVMRARCFFCHTNAPERVPGSEDKYVAEPLPISCERCHGPGSRHVEERLADPAPATDVDPTIVNPAHLDLDRRLDVCQQCHLNGPVVRIRDGRDDYDFLPSQSLADHQAIYVETQATTGGAIAVVSHADRMQQSACFLETQGTPQAMDCVTCHNPHEGFRTAGPAYFNRTCQQCHAPAALAVALPEAARAIHAEAANCISCHMPRVGADDAPHSLFTDHFIRVLGEGEATEDPDAPVVLRAYYPQDTVGTLGKVYDALARINYGWNRGDAEMLSDGIAQVQSRLTPDVEVASVHLMLGQALLLQGRAAEAVAPLVRAYALDGGDVKAQHALARAYAESGQSPEQADALFRQVLSEHPTWSTALADYGQFLDQAGRFDEARRYYEQAVAEEPWLPRAHNGLGVVALKQQAFAEAAQAFRQALALDPDYADALTNLGAVLMQQDDLDGAATALEKAVALTDGDLLPRFNLALVYLQQGKLGEGIEALQGIIRQVPGHVNAHLLLARAYLLAGRRAQAREAALQAQRLDPSNPMAQQILQSLGG